MIKQKTAYAWRMSDGSSDVCSSDLQGGVLPAPKPDVSHTAKAGTRRNSRPPYEGRGKGSANINYTSDGTPCPAGFLKRSPTCGINAEQAVTFPDTRVHNVTMEDRTHAHLRTPAPRRRVFVPSTLPELAAVTRTVPHTLDRHRPGPVMFA